MTIGILGGGVWGSALAKLFSDKEVLIYTRDKKVKNSINDHHFNPKLKYATFNDNVKATDDLENITKKKFNFYCSSSTKYSWSFIKLIFPEFKCWCNYCV